MKTIFLILAALALGSSCQADPYNFGTYWKSLPMDAKYTYAYGVRDGIAAAFFQAETDWLQKDEKFLTRREPTRKKVFLMFEAKTLIPLMNDIYNDPANAFIQPIAVLYLSRDKLQGDDITAALVEARKRAIEDHELNSKIKSN